MKKIFKKIHRHANRRIHPSLAFPIIIFAAFLLIDMPLFSLAQEITDLTPIVHQYKQYKIAQSEQPTLITEPATVVAPDPVPAVDTEPKIETQTATEVKTETSNETQPSQSLPASEPNKTEMIQKEMIQELNEQEEQIEVEFIDPREVKNALNEIKRMQVDMKRFVKQLKKMPNVANDVNFANDLLAQLNEHYKSISNPPADASLREVMQEFWDARLWEEVDRIRARVEIPRELTNIAKDLKKLKKNITLKAYKNLGFNLDSIAESIAEMETAYAEAKTNYDQGNLEDAWTAMEIFHSGMQPGEIMGVLNQTKDIKDRTRIVKNQEVKEIIAEVISNVIESADAGDFREANQALNEIRNELMKIMNKFAKQTSVLDDKTRNNLDKLENVLQNKLNNADFAPLPNKQ